MTNKSELEESIRQTAETYNSLDIERIMAMFEPDVQAWWNGTQVAGNAGELRQWFLGGLVGQSASLAMRKTLMVTADNVIGVHWQHDAVFKNGQSSKGCGNEFWSVRDGRVATWNAVGTEIGA
jgi:nuclear transport factor 2 (NTF2) superfamily protein